MSVKWNCCCLSEDFFGALAAFSVQRCSQQRLGNKSNASRLKVNVHEEAENMTNPALSESCKLPAPDALHDTLCTHHDVHDVYSYTIVVHSWQTVLVNTETRDMYIYSNGANLVTVV